MISKFHALTAALSLLCSIYSGSTEWSIIMHFTHPWNLLQRPTNALGFLVKIHGSVVKYRGV